MKGEVVPDFLNILGSFGVWCWKLVQVSPTWATDSGGNETGFPGCSSPPSPPPLRQEPPGHCAPRSHWSTPWQPGSLLPADTLIHVVLI